MAYLGDNIGKLGFGLMRLPKNGDAIDIEQVKTMVDMFMDAGFTYFDTAWAYPGSEDAIRQALVERYPRESFQLATKNAAWINCKTREDAIAQFETSLRQTGAGYIDFYLLHNLGQTRTAVFDRFDMWGFAEDMKKQGKIRHLGMSFHSTAKELDVILRDHPEIEFVQLQINYADWDNKLIQSRKCYEVARKYDKPVIIMEPVKGGLLAKPPEKVEKILHNADPNASCASWAIRFAASLDGIVTVLSGMSNIEQMENNLSYMREFKKLSNREEKTIIDAREALASYPIVPCTSCNYCAKVCPENVGISSSLVNLNIYTLYGNKEFPVGQLQWEVDGTGKKRATECIKCGKCEEACPQHIDIRKELEKVSKAFYT